MGGTPAGSIGEDDPVTVTAAELIVLVDDTGEPIGTLPKPLVHHGETPLHRAFSAYLFSDDGRLLVTRRAADKQTFPGMWTNTVCGHPGPGEADAAAPPGPPARAGCWSPAARPTSRPSRACGPTPSAVPPAPGRTTPPRSPAAGRRSSACRSRPCALRCPATAPPARPR